MSWLGNTYISLHSTIKLYCQYRVHDKSIVMMVAPNSLVHQKEGAQGEEEEEEEEA